MSLNAQIAFDGPAAYIDSLNSPNGQNYLILHPEERLLAFAEEQGGSGSFELIKDSQTFLEKNWDVTILPDFLVDEGMYSPIGFINDQLVIGEVTYDRGVYTTELKVIRENGQVSLDIPFMKSKSPTVSGTISKDGRFMILSLETNDTYGVEDLYLTRRDVNGDWSSLKNLGSMLNTEYQEITPFLAADNRTLFFATNGRGGEGSFDLFYTVRQDESWRNWSTPVNLGSQINTSGSETSFSFQDGSDWAFFVSSQDSDGYGDIMQIKIKEDIDEDTVQTTFPKLEDVIAKEIMIKISDRKTSELLAGQLIFDTLEIFVPAGVFVLDSMYLKYGEVEVKMDGYLPKMIPLDKELLIGVNEIIMDRIEMGETFLLENVLFRRGTSELLEGSSKELNLVVEMMNDNPEIKILLKGHTDNTGDPVKNILLSEERVKAVKQYLVDQGISPYRIRGRGYGGNLPVASNSTEETRKLNRRVEFEVVED